VYVYRTYTESSREYRLESDTIAELELESIAVSIMRKFSNRSLRFNSYIRGLNGRQAAWASRKYSGHRVLPNDIMESWERRGL
jgi:hypothetical protein